MSPGPSRCSTRGPGSRPADLPHVFDRFYRADTARALPGSGLGLAIVQQVVASSRRNGGRRLAPGRGHPDPHPAPDRGRKRTRLARASTTPSRPSRIVRTGQPISRAGHHFAVRRGRPAARAQSLRRAGVVGARKAPSPAKTAPGYYPGAPPSLRVPPAGPAVSRPVPWTRPGPAGRPEYPLSLGLKWPMGQLFPMAPRHPPARVARTDRERGQLGRAQGSGGRLWPWPRPLRAPATDANSVTNTTGAAPSADAKVRPVGGSGASVDGDGPEARAEVGRAGPGPPSDCANGRSAAPGRRPRIAAIRGAGHCTLPQSVTTDCTSCHPVPSPHNPDQRSWLLGSVPGAGFEPACPFGQWCLRPSRLPVPPSGREL